jgi:hypothetical protein
LQFVIIIFVTSCKLQSLPETRNCQNVLNELGRLPNRYHVLLLSVSQCACIRTVKLPSNAGHGCHTYQ